MHPRAQVNWLARWKGEHDRETLVREVAKEYAFLHPDVAVNCKFHQEVGLPNEKTIAAKIAEMIRTGTYEWDIVPVNTGQYRDVAQLLGDPEWGRKYLVDFGAVPGFAETQKPCIVEDPLYRAQFGGMFVGPYIEGFYCMLWYNRDVAERIGIEVRQYGMTVEDFAGYLRAVDDYNRAHGSSIAAIHEAKDWRTTEYLFRHLFCSAVGDLAAVREEVATEAKRAALLKTFEALERFGLSKPLGDKYDEHVWFDTRHLVLDGEALFFVNGSWMYSHWMDIDAAKTQRMMPAELPVFQPVDFTIGSFTPQFAVLKNAPNAVAAVELLMFWATPKVAEKWVRYTKAPTGLAGNLSTSDVANDQFERFQHRMNQTYQGRLHFSDDVGFILGEKNELLTAAVNEQVVHLLAGRTTAQQDYEAVMAQCQ
jgi:ABC-type glycerol-3-phosphate transport system substrate-binding protein